MGNKFHFSFDDDTIEEEDVVKENALSSRSLRYHCVKIDEKRRDDPIAFPEDELTSTVMYNWLYGRNYKRYVQIHSIPQSTFAFRDISVSYTDNYFVYAYADCDDGEIRPIIMSGWSLPHIFKMINSHTISFEDGWYISNIHIVRVYYFAVGSQPKIEDYIRKYCAGVNITKQSKISELVGPYSLTCIDEPTHEFETKMSLDNEIGCQQKAYINTIKNNGVLPPEFYMFETSHMYGSFLELYYNIKDFCRHGGRIVRLDPTYSDIAKIHDTIIPGILTGIYNHILLAHEGSVNDMEACKTVLVIYVCKDESYLWKFLRSKIDQGILIPLVHWTLYPYVKIAELPKIHSKEAEYKEN